MNRQFTRRAFIVATTVVGSVVDRLAAQGPTMISGRVIWEGSVPKVPAFRAMVSPLAENRDRVFRDWPNPLAPKIDPATRGMAGVLVHLKEPAGGENLPALAPVRLIARDGQIILMQGKEPRQMGVVRPGDAVELVSEQDRMQMVRARGAAFWSVPLVKRGQPTQRACPTAGWTEISSGAGQYWARAHVWATNTPYVAWTDPNGQFQIGPVPAGGSFTVVAHVPDWRLEKVDRDPESMEPARADYRGARSFEASAIPGVATVLTVPASAFSTGR